jgi:coenzyme PQQ precursor peptide PqqA
MISWLVLAIHRFNMRPGALEVPAAATWRCATFSGDTMKWETPTATDLRFGFEITMYVSAR